MSRSKSPSFLLGTFAGIPVKIHWSFGFIILLIAYIGFKDQLSIEGFLWLALTIISLFTCVVLHEYGHALTARRYGIKTADILLTPIGGIARLKGMPKKPIQEFIIAIAGPLVNVVIVIITLIYLFFTIDRSTTELLEDMIIIDSFSELVLYLFFLNAMLFLFNLIPAFPMDGGRILRSLLSMKMDRIKATRIASIAGRIIAVGFVIIAIIYSHFSLGFIGVFVYIMAQREFKMVRTEERISKAIVRDVMRKQFQPLYNYQKINDALNLYNQSKEKSFLVLNQLNQIEGVIHELFLKNLPKEFSPEDPIFRVMSQRFEIITPDLSLPKLFQLMQNNGYSILPVMENGQLVAVIDRNDVTEFVKKEK